MSFLVSTKYRSHQEEIMDDLDYNGPKLHDSLDKMAQINKWLGGNKVTLNGLTKLLKHHPNNKPITIVDLGCGGGDLLRQIYHFGKRHKYNFMLIGIDANPNTIAYAKASSESLDNIEFMVMDVFSEDFKQLNFDVVLATLFLHHFKEDELVSFLKATLKKAHIGMIVNDLHRHQLAYYLFRVLCITIKNQITVKDGLLSILRGFKRKELERMSDQLQAYYSIQWKWAFRYQWLLSAKQI